MDAAYDNTYHHNLRGRIWRALEETKYEAFHGDGEPNPFSYSNPFPPGDLEEGDERTILFASPREELLTHLAEDLQRDPELNIGEMPFHLDGLSAVNPSVGEPGSMGTIESGTGVLVRIPPWRFDEYDIDAPDSSSEFWRPEYSIKPFRRQVRSNLDKKHTQFCRDDLPGPTDNDGDLFDEYELIKTFALPVTVTQGQTETCVLSKWRLRYTVRNDHHRRHLNLALDTGIGERNGLGFGFVNITEKSTPRGKAANAFS